MVIELNDLDVRKGPISQWKGPPHKRAFTGGSPRDLDCRSPRGRKRLAGGKVQGKREGKREASKDLVRCDRAFPGLDHEEGDGPCLPSRSPLGDCEVRGSLGGHERARGSGLPKAREGREGREGTASRRWRQESKSPRRSVGRPTDGPATGGSSDRVGERIKASNFLFRKGYYSGWGLVYRGFNGRIYVVGNYNYKEKKKRKLKKKVRWNVKVVREWFKREFDRCVIYTIVIRLYIRLVNRVRCICKVNALHMQVKCIAYVRQVHCICRCIAYAGQGVDIRVALAECRVGKSDPGRQGRSDRPPDGKVRPNMDEIFGQARPSWAAGWPKWSVVNAWLPTVCRGVNVNSTSHLSIVPA
ncbi:hypothetical protein B0T20DRAFT_398324 [Sordaria brevicollis]|uniref:Uncharacterized protein n=1 Tax=Sordaria brevicollis TaxID=83679 RepID=A0AAE0NR90_SORBR|nr:hypothetical protein B0T20DRAFT_398324 [Sordaria brevicollis]